ncbi:MAG: hypothetical protein EXR78_01405 [Deltaproteobacteria bacterium]|nr:hypothetical protein [Deltaproteobacteria bacterium]
MTCEEIREELVAYHDGELAEQDRHQVVAHLSTCPACTQEAASLARIGQMFSSLERGTPSPDFAANFWRRLEQGRHPQPESRPENWFAQWWRDLRESMTTWHLTPALVGVASVLIFFATLAQKPDRTATTSGPDSLGGPQSLSTEKPATVAKPTTSKAAPTVSTEVMEKSDLFIDYKIITELDKFARLEEIAAVDLSTEQPVEVAEAEIPKEVLEDPGFFAQYQILQQLERLKNFDAVLASPTRDDTETQG